MSLMSLCYIQRSVVFFVDPSKNMFNNNSLNYALITYI